MSPLQALRAIAEYPAPTQDDMQAANMRKIATDAIGAGGVERLRSVEVCAVCGDGQAHLVRFCDTCGSEYAGVAETRRVQAVAEPTRGNWIAAEDVDRLTRELDVALNGSGAASQAALCDVVAQAVDAARKAGRPLLAQPVAIPDGWRLAPTRLTQAMADAAKTVDGRLSVWKYDDAYQAMLANAPEAPAPAPNALDAETAFLQETDQYLLHRFIETSEDDESYDISKDEVKRLANLGVLESCGFGRYGVTMFGYWAHERFWHQNPSLPLKTNTDRDREKRAAIAAQSAQGAKP